MFPTNIVLADMWDEYKLDVAITIKNSSKQTNLPPLQPPDDVKAAEVFHLSAKQKGSVKK